MIAANVTRIASIRNRFGQKLRFYHIVGVILMHYQIINKSDPYSNESMDTNVADVKIDSEVFELLQCDIAIWSKFETELSLS
jgi:hypothetical protein